MGVDINDEFELCRYNWIKEICEFPWNIAISLTSFPYANRQTLLLELFRPYEWYTIQGKDEGEKFLNELFIVMQSRVFPLSMCVMLTYLAISIFQSILNKARTVSFLIVEYFFKTIFVFQSKVDLLNRKAKIDEWRKDVVFYRTISALKSFSFSFSFTFCVT